MMIDTIAVIGAGNGGKALAADMALQGRKVRLFEFPEYAANTAEITKSHRLNVRGEIEGEAELEVVTDDPAEAVDGADTVMVCVQAPAHERAARALAPLLSPERLVLVNPGSIGGSLRFARVFRELGMEELPFLAETATLTYGCRGAGPDVDIYLKVRRVVYGCFPSRDIGVVGPDLEALFPGLVRGASVLEAGLNNANPVIHPAIALLNAARIENEGARMLFYADGVSPAVVRLIKKLDGERMALLRALGYPAQTDPETSAQQGYADSADYFECYKRGPVFRGFTSPDTIDHRYFHEDVGVGLVMFCELGRLLGAPTPASEAVVRMCSVIQGIDYMSRAERALASLGVGGMSVEELKGFLETGRRADGG